MSFAAPAFLLAGLAAALGVVALHLIVMRQPPSAVFPTARFIPARPAVARTVTRVPEDLLLLALRVLALLALGAAFARPVLHPRRARVLHIVMVDQSRAVGDERAVVDSARGIVVGAGGSPTVLVVFDSAARVSDGGADVALTRLRRSEARGVVSSALVGALRVATQQRDRADSVELTLVSPLVGEEVDAATDSIRALWPGAVRVVRVAARVDSAGVRPTVDWPADGHARGTVRRQIIDTVGAVVASRAAVVVAPFERRWAVDSVDRAAWRVLARWVDGEPAAVERVVGSGCVHAVMVPKPSEGDLVVRPEFRRFVAALDAPCGRDGGDAGARTPVVWATDSVPAWRVASGRLPGQTSTVGHLGLVIGLLTVAALALLAEPLVRGGGA